MNHIIEIASLITDGELNIIAEGPEIVIHQSDEILDMMNEWCVTQHGKSGLTDRVRSSKISLAEAEKQTLDFIHSYTGSEQVPLCGNTIGQDKVFLQKYMPTIVDQLHYRVVDVSTIKELALRWYPHLEIYDKKGNHRALDDIRESVAELQYYRAKIFNPIA